VDRILAIDPGKSGGLVWETKDRGIVAEKMPEFEWSLRDLLRSAISTDGVTVAIVENVPKYVGRAIPSSSAAVLFDNYGFCKGVLMAFGLPLYLITPQTWQKPLGLGTMASAGGKSEWKKKLLGEAQRRYPSLNLTLATADACLLYDYLKHSRV